MSDLTHTRDDQITGSCLCGAVQYTVTGKLRDVINCHCSLCRKFHGHYAAYTSAPHGKVQIKNENDSLAWYQGINNHARRGFCVICGSSLFWDLENSDTICIAAGTLDQPTGLSTTTDIYVADKADYYHLSSQLEKFERGL